MKNKVNKVINKNITSKEKINNKCNFIDDLLIDNGLYKGIPALIEIEEHISNLYNEIEQLQHQLEKKQKIYAIIRDGIYDYLDSNKFSENFETLDNEYHVRNHIFKILERGENEVRIIIENDRNI